MHIIYNEDGSLKFLSQEETIQKGNTGVNFIYVAIQNRSNDTYTATAYFELPNGTTTFLTGSTETFTLDGNSYNGYKITLTSAVTLYAGNLQVAVKLADLSSNVLYTYETSIIINNTPAELDETTITLSQYNALLQSLNSYQIKYVVNNVRSYSSITTARADTTNLADGQVVIVIGAGGIPHFYYKAINTLFEASELQEKLVSGTNIKTINGQSLLGNGNIEIQASSVNWGNINGTLSNQTDLQTALNGKQATLTAGTGISIVNNVISNTQTSAEWGNIEGTLSDQTDLQNELDALDDRINNLSALGRYLSTWNCATGLAGSDPTTSPYTYKTGDYFIVGVVASGSSTNYRPSGTTYTIGVASTTPELDDVEINDYYRFDGTTWELIKGEEKQIAFSSIAGQPSDNANLNTALNSKVDLTSAQTITGVKTFGNGLKVSGAFKFEYYGNDSLLLRVYGQPAIAAEYGKLYSLTNGDLGQTANKWKDLYLSGKIVGATQAICPNSANFTFYREDGISKVLELGNYDGYEKHRYTIVPMESNNVDLGGISRKFRDLYLSGKLTDGTNEITVANIQGKPTMVVNTTDTEFAEVVANGEEYYFTQPLTSMLLKEFLIGSNYQQEWSLTFIVGSGFTLTSYQTIRYAYGTPNFELGATYNIVVKPDLVSNQYVVYVVRM